jgi:hypothetical protein
LYERRYFMIDKGVNILQVSQTYNRHASVKLEY